MRISSPKREELITRKLKKEEIQSARIVWIAIIKTTRTRHLDTADMLQIAP